MIVYDKEQKEIVIPNGIGNINLFNNGVEAGYNQGYEQGQADMAAKARVLNVTENGVYKSKFSDPVVPTVTGVYADGTEFYNYAELNGKIFNTKIAGSINSRLEFWYKGDNTLAGYVNNVIIGSGDTDKDNSFQVKYFDNHNNSIIRVRVGISIGDIREWDNTVWHHFIVSKTEGGVWIDGKHKFYFVYDGTIDGEFFINGIGYDVNSDGGGTRNANGYFGMIKIDDTIIIPTADGFLNTNTGELLEVVKDGGYTFTENDPIYGEGELYKTINVNVPDLNGSYDEGYAQGKIDGANEQKSKLESISITENGVYSKEDGYNHIEVNVPDLNGSYDEGYEQGQADVAANARVLNVTENGNYLSKFSDPVIPTLVTGRYADGTDFYSYAELSNKIFNTKIAASENSRLEFWYKGDNMKSSDGFNVIIGAGNNDNQNCFQVRYFVNDNDRIKIDLGGDDIIIEGWDDTVWHHLIVSKAEGLWIDGEKKKEYEGTIYYPPEGEFYINGIGYSKDGSRSANGTFGMIKIDDTTIIPTADGFQNTNTGELIEVVKNGSYIFTENKIRYGEGELFKTINVDVIPKINVQKEGIKLAYGTFTEVPEWADFEGITNMSNMFYVCLDLKTIPFIDTSSVTNMEMMLYNCGIETIPFLDTSNVINANAMFQYCRSLKTLPNNFNFGSCTNLSNMFNTADSLTDYSFLETWVINPNADMNEMISSDNVVYVPAIPCVGNNGYTQSAIFWTYGEFSKLTYFGGWIGRKYNVTQDYILNKMPNLTKESCISILNNLYDFTGNGETPNSDQGHLKCHPNFLTTVGDEISIATSKGWVVSA